LAFRLRMGLPSTLGDAGVLGEGANGPCLPVVSLDSISEANGERIRHHHPKPRGHHPENPLTPPETGSIWVDGICAGGDIIGEEGSLQEASAAAKSPCAEDSSSRAETPCAKPRRDPIGGKRIECDSLYTAAPE
jgi:hypothetical protein